MLTVPHVIAGAALGSLVGDVPGQTVLAFAVGWGSHYVLDATPHWERLFGPNRSGFSTQMPVSEWPKSFLYQALGDALLALGITTLLLYNSGTLALFWTSPIFWGAVGGFFPDLLDNTPVINNYLGKYRFVQRERKFHHDNHVSDEVQQKVPKYFGLITQLVVCGVGLWILL
ncbi:MAG: hypothetical protein WD157_00740 [Patescibacteria group bacterium]